MHFSLSLLHSFALLLTEQASVKSLSLHSGIPEISAALPASSEIAFEENLERKSECFIMFSVRNFLHSVDCFNCSFMFFLLFIFLSFMYIFFCYVSLSFIYSYVRPLISGLLCGDFVFLLLCSYAFILSYIYQILSSSMQLCLHSLMHLSNYLFFHAISYPSFPT